jgi:hypothetical protein
MQHGEIVAVETGQRDELSSVYHFGEASLFRQDVKPSKLLEYGIDADDRSPTASARSTWASGMVALLMGPLPAEPAARTGDRRRAEALAVGLC